MKSSLKFLAGVLIISLAFAGCKKDKKAPSNFFKIGNKNYSISSGTLENYGVDTDTADFWEYSGYNLDLAFFSKDLVLETTQQGYLNVSGTGQIIYFEIFSANASSLEEGDFIYDASNGPFEVQTFDYSDYALEWDDQKQDNNWTKITGGKITSKKTGSSYEITINCTDENGNDVTGVYKGPLQYYNYETFLKSTLPHSGKPAKFMKGLR